MSILTHRPAEGNLIRLFAAKPVPGVSTIKHLGWDIGWGRGYEVYAAAAGRVSFVRWSANTKTNDRRGGYGNYFIIDHGHGITTLYAHQPNTPMLVRLGEQVDGGQHVGTMGNTGNAAGDHLHFEVRRNGVPVDPTDLFAKTAPAGTVGTPLPTIPAPPARRKKTMSTGFYWTDGKSATARGHALAGDGVGAAAWIPVTYDEAQDLAEIHGPFVKQTVAQFAAKKALYTSAPAAFTVTADPASLTKVINAINALPVGIAAENARRVAS